MQKGSFRRRGAVAVSCVLPVVLAGIATAAAQEITFKDKIVTVVVPTGSGGTHHVFGQLVQHHIGKHLPGNPSVLIQNRQGGGGATAAAYMENVAPKDGTVICELTPGMLTEPLIRPQLKYDAFKFRYLGAIAARPYVLAVWHTAPVRSFEDLKKTEIIMGTNGRASTGYIIPVFLNNVLGTRMKVITGYKSGGETNLAMERGEVHGRGNYYSGFVSITPQWIAEKKVRFLLAIGPTQPELKDVPHARSLLKPGTMEAKLYELLEVNFNVGQAFFAPPGTPNAVMAVLRKAFDALKTDPAIIKEAEQRGVEFMPRSGVDLERDVQAGLKAAEPAVVERLRAVMTASRE